MTFLSILARLGRMSRRDTQTENMDTDNIGARVWLCSSDVDTRADRPADAELLINNARRQQDEKGGRGRGEKEARGGQESGEWRVEGETGKMAGQTKVRIDWHVCMHSHYFYPYTLINLSSKSINLLGSNYSFGQLDLSTPSLERRRRSRRPQKD